MKCRNTAASVDDSLTIISSLLTATDISYTEMFCKGMLWDLELLYARSYNNRAALKDSGVPTKCTMVILDMSPGPDVVGKSLFPRRWLSLIGRVHNYSLTSAAKTPLRVTGVVKLRVTMGECTMDVGLLVADNLAVDVLLGTMFIDAIVRTISPKRRSVSMTQGGITSILDDVRWREDAEAITTMQDQHGDKATSFSTAKRHCWVCRQVTLKARPEILVLLQSYDSSLVVPRPHGSLLKFLQVQMARVIAELTLRLSFLYCWVVSPIVPSTSQRELLLQALSTFQTL